MNKALPLLVRWFALGWLAIAPAAALAQTPAGEQDRRLVESSSANLAFLIGTGWNGPGQATRDVVTFEYGNTWRFGDTFMFLDLAHLVTRDASDSERPTRSLMYAEIQPRFSMGRLLGRCLCLGAVRDVLTAHEINVSGGGGLVHLHGLGLAWRVPGGGLKTNLYVRDDLDISGVTWQLLVAGLVRFEAAGQPFSIGGFTDFVGGEGSRSANIFSAIQFLWDAGSTFVTGNQLLAGIELHTSINHLGTEGLDEFVPQAMVKWVF